MRTIAGMLVLGCACLALNSCGDNGGSGGKANLTPLLVNVKATPSPAWANAAVAFTASCVSANPDTQAGLAGLVYTWSFRDSAGRAIHTDTTPIGSDVYNFLASGSSATAAAYTTYQYQVQCTDKSLPGTPSIATAWQTIQVWSNDLTALDSSVCSSGVQGFGWCWQNPTPTGRSLRAVAAVSPLNGWAVGDGGVILETNDGGSTWLTKYPGLTGPPQDYLAINATDQNKAAIVASDGSVLRTSDAGANWTKDTPSTVLSLTSASMVNPNLVWAINDNSSVVQTTTGGSSWSSITVPNLSAGAQLNAIAALNSGTATVVGADEGVGIIAQSIAGKWAPFETISASDLVLFLLRTFVRIRSR